MPMPRKNDPRDIRFTMRLSGAEAAEFQRRAEAAGCSLTAYARQAILGEFSESASAITTPAPDPAAYALAEQVRRVGVNLNQIAHRFNEQGIAPSPDELHAVLTDIRRYVAEAQARR